jgi:hypothetical protein
LILIVRELLLLAALGAVNYCYDCTDLGASDIETGYNTFFGHGNEG